jgi:hypothetical protein
MLVSNGFWTASNYRTASSKSQGRATHEVDSGTCHPGGGLGKQTDYKTGPSIAMVLLIKRR